MNVGYCKFCGQGARVDTDRELMQEDLDMMATDKCQCEKAKHERYVKETMEKAQAAIEDLLEEENAQIRGEMMALTEMIVTGKIMAAVLKSKSGAKVSVKMDSKMNIKFNGERKETRGAEV